uniref:Uncharacterized protein n=1 Tax=Trichobilharzia regenti TaxID=157069 RepID=A0AA85J4T8_TRIRE
MVVLNAFTYKNEKVQREPASFYIWFFVDLIITILITVSAIVLITQVSAVCRFFKDHDYVIYILYSVGAILLFLCVFVTNFQSKYIPLRILLGMVVALWSVSFATEFESVQITFVFISLGVTTAVTITAIILAFMLPPLNDKGFVVFTGISMLLAVSAIIVKICCYLITQNTQVFCIVAAILIGLFIFF